MSYSVMLCIIYTYKKTFDDVFSEGRAIRLEQI